MAHNTASMASNSVGNFISADMSRPVNWTCQPETWFVGTTTVKDALTQLLRRAEASQSKLIKYLNGFASRFNMVAYDPRVKSINSATNKVLHRSANTKAKVRLLTDVYRASIIVG